MQSPKKTNETGNTENLQLLGEMGSKGEAHRLLTRTFTLL